MEVYFYGGKPFVPVCKAEEAPGKELMTPSKVAELI